MGSAQEEVRQEPRALWEKMQAERTACAKALEAACAGLQHTRAEGSWEQVWPGRG